MKKSIGGAMLFNIVIIFLIVVFAILAGTLSYTKAYRMNSKIINALERHEGYLKGSTKCPEKKLNGVIGSAQPGDRYQYCVYLFDNDIAQFDKNRQYYSYGVMTYMTFNLPIIGTIRIPIFGKTNRIYRCGA